jgi:hypothetical protein
MTTAQSFDTERDLTPDEIIARSKLRDELDEERDGLITAVEDRRREIRGFVAKRKKIEAQLRDVRRELRTGKVFDSPQVPLVFPDVLPTLARHGEGELLDPAELLHLITCVRPREFWPSLTDVESWHEQVRADVQKWCRTEHTRAAPIAGSPLPDSFDMPNVLQNIRFRVEEKAARKRKAASKRKAGKRKAGKR